ncbi:galactosyltransferase-related protein [Paracoccus sp. 1_MG-2023]|uniref:glycosyltransferase family 2 protein n=1 Tax=unclassified Paracoccus (in: a-proteobacteria) TaxID=2688777 RepID=UPI001C09BE7F|nr:MULTISPECIES: galactosyltransferase-related protein [unclassified Paracoccus (in: a-proteobacteria)]MBU2956051.1 glycosyltransferase [Paracoccus sp. C2R09]MDO6669457.1 galactosyltransferase-related protein [Paracoccus sp. 1_MG-2023]
MATVSALTIAAGRSEHLANVVRGFDAQTTPPAELVIAVMQPEPYADLPEVSFPVRQIMIPVADGNLPLAAARNTAARQAVGDVLVFVDVDCIPAPGLIAEYAAAAEPGQGLLMGEVMYLPDQAERDGIDYALFDRLGVRHSDRQAPPPEGKRECNDYRCFWSLNFAIHRQDWDEAGGFDEGYVGYGGEDTDFGRILHEKGIAIWWLKGARVYHQYHPHCMPPIHQVPSVVRNAEYFASKWGHRTMEHWLHAFRLLGLIENTPEGLRVLREPNERDFALCRQEPHMPYANTRRVLDRIQGITGKDRNDPARVAQVETAQADLLTARAV